MEKSSPNWIFGALLVSGVTIGISFLTIPLVASVTGFFPGMIMSILVWLFIVSVGILYAEASLASVRGANVITLCRSFLGPLWMWLIAPLFAFSMYVYLSGYFLVASQTFNFLFSTISSFETPIFMGLFFGAILWFGMRWANRLNFILCMGLFIAFILSLLAGHKDVNLIRLTHQHWVFVIFAIPVLFSALAFAPFVPSLCTFLQEDRIKIRRAIIVGTFIPLIIYILWQWLMIGISESGVLQLGYEERDLITPIFPSIQKIPYLSFYISFVTLFTLTTSILGVGIIILDFLKDGFQLRYETRLNRFFLCLVTFVPSVFCAIVFPNFILLLLKYAIAPWSQLIFNGVLPLWLASVVRYKYSLVQKPLLLGGKGAIIFLVLILFFIFYLEVIQWMKG